MFAISTTEAGTCTGSPDVCMTPVPGPAGAIPVPYVNQAFCRTAVQTAPRLLIRNRPALTKISVMPISTGNEPGMLGGVRSGRQVGPCRYQTTSATVYAGSHKVAVHQSMTTQNAGNCIGFQFVPSQSSVFARS